MHALQSSAGSQKLLDNVERYALYLALSANDSATVTTWNASNMGGYSHTLLYPSILQYMHSVAVDPPHGSCIDVTRQC